MLVQAMLPVYVEPEEPTVMMSALFTGATGLVTHGKGMKTVTNNLANVNTVGFKQTMMLYSDLTSQYQPAPSNYMTNISQKGLGVQAGATRTVFTQMAFEKGSEATDLGISGRGFFGVTKDGVTQYTRAGNFRFTKDGALVDPNGWTVMGRAINNGVEASTPTPIQLDLSSNGANYMPAKATSAITATSQLGGMENKSDDPNNPFFAMLSGWDATAESPLGTGQYSYREALEYYDSTGESRTAYIYYDQAGVSNGRTVMEYVVAMDPAEDASGRGGLLMAGTLTFGSGGHLENVTAFTSSSGNPQDLSSWTPASLANGSPVFTITPTGGETQTISLDMGLSLSESSSAGLGSAAEAAANSAAIYSAATGATLQARASTNYGSSPASTYQGNDGYSEGYLSNVQVDSDGIMTGIYSNGQNQDLFRVSLYRFISEDGLNKEGKNHFSATQESGPAEEGIPGTENYGTIADYSLEQSNVDYAREFTTMIITQRGFQMNSKVVTTADQMLQKALELKR